MWVPLTFKDTCALIISAEIRIRAGKSSIRDLAVNAEPHAASPMERKLEKWEITEDKEHLRLYFNLYQFVAIPILNGPVIFTQENKGTLMVTQDNQGQLEYRVSFCNEP
ncbi:hypothetical protein EDM56_00105 [Brevibacillus fluminis]|uniref:Uncharacterized protein n=1 Tax=Brevibacillus fluminis TaxID=511487 RepID=A0A3M8DXC8_9BACL|nr:hypothetical protein EDM56_00105 [Brevibacillus fluminis]